MDRVPPAARGCAADGPASAANPGQDRWHRRRVREPPRPRSSRRACDCECGRHPRAPTHQAACRETEFRRQRRLTPAHSGYVGIDSGCKGDRDGSRVRRVSGPLLLHVAAVEKQASRPILRDVVRPKILREQAQPTFAPQIDLPQAISRGVVALREVCVLHAASIDVWDAPAIDHDADRARKAGNYARLLRGFCSCRRVRYRQQATEQGSTKNR